MFLISDYIIIATEGEIQEGHKSSLCSHVHAVAKYSVVCEFNALLYMYSVSGCLSTD